MSAVTSSSRPTVRTITIRPTGTIMAPPMPCRKRAATKKPKECAIPQSMELTMNIAIAEQNTIRPPIRSVSQPDIGIKTARLTR